MATSRGGSTSYFKVSGEGYNERLKLFSSDCFFKEDLEGYDQARGSIS
jgi:hypothetical protein